MNRFLGAALRMGLGAMAGSFLRQTHRARAVASQTLAHILERNGSTEWGHRHGLDGPHPLAAFQRMEVTSYADYEPYIERVAAGAPGILTSEPVTYFAVTSGTTGRQKLIPVTRRQTRAIMSTMMAPIGLAVRAGLIPTIRGRYLQMMTELSSGVTTGGIPKGAATTGGLKAMGGMIDALWTSPLPVLQVQEQTAARYLHLLFALGEERLWAVVSIFPSTLLYAMRDLHTRAPELLRDLHDGSITHHVDLAPGARAELAGRLRPNPVRARALSRLLEQGRFRLPDIWPAAGAVFSVTSGTFGFYVDQLRPYVGDLPVLSSVYAASEATVGIGLPGRPGYILAPAAAYHEFLPVSGGGRPLGLHEVEEGGVYEVLLTTYAGLTRYRLGDTVRVLGRHGEAPVLAFLERVGRVINIGGEKTSEAQVSAAFTAASQRLAAEVSDYVVTPNPTVTPACYLLLVEGVGDGLDLDALGAAFDEELSRTAPGYGAHRSRGALRAAQAIRLPLGTFERYRAERVAGGASASQVKVPHVVPDPDVARRHFLNQEVPL